MIKRKLKKVKEIFQVVQVVSDKPDFKPRFAWFQKACALFWASLSLQNRVSTWWACGLARTKPLAAQTRVGWDWVLTPKGA